MLVALKRLSVDGGADERVGYVEYVDRRWRHLRPGQMLSVMEHFRCEEMPVLIGPMALAMW